MTKWPECILMIFVEGVVGHRVVTGGTVRDVVTVRDLSASPRTGASVAVTGHPGPGPWNM